MESLVISMFIGIIIIAVFIPIDKIRSKKNLHKLILFLNQREYKPRTNAESFKDRVFIFAEKKYKKLNIKISEDKYNMYKNKLMLANLSDKLSVECILGMKILTSILVFLYVGVLAAIDVSLMMFILLIIATVLGYCCPDSMLNIRIKKRQQQLQRELPNVLKTLAITTEAGLNFWEAIKKVCEIKKGVLIDEFKNMLDEINMGALQKDALMKLSERCGVTDITIFVFTIMQSLEKGAKGVTKALNEQANEVWEIRKSKAKELGQKASVKLFFSMLIFVFPCLLIFLLGPAVMSILKLFTNN
ncbi:bacterial type II secretion system protein F domain protein [Clostridium puniceum]|uniref:Bacterial type II secretion system protein F domain protein n=1 Tax=Clostridium puniceum TaxID=29367 RepID=A0A1S8TSC1_9CLOT|nr:type II secretion system F family protein [Clostridium puniceum]OOM80584.1 bacterial type II secretion system protein F domain protein [Clostridium puniceum]